MISQLDLSLELLVLSEQSLDIILLRRLTFNPCLFHLWSLFFTLGLLLRPTLPDFLHFTVLQRLS